MSIDRYSNFFKFYIFLVFNPAAVIIIMHDLYIRIISHLKHYNNIKNQAIMITLICLMPLCLYKTL